MRNRLKVLLLITAVSTFSWGIDMSTKQLNNAQGSNVWLKVTDRPGNPQDWIGVYHKGASNTWANQVAWTWAKDTSSYKDWYKLSTSSLPNGEYEARFFLNNSYTVEKKVSFAIKNTVTLSSADDYTGHDVNIGISNQASSSENWVGLYPAGSSNAWDNVVDWKWSTSESQLSFTNVPSGKYEARIFYNNSFDIENAVYFTVGTSTVDIKADKNTYATDDTVHLNITNQAEDNQNWVGIYPSGSSNEWANVVDWTWTKGQSSLIFDTPSAGNYEARLFYNNSYHVEDKVAFSVQNDAGGDYVYGSEGKYLDKVIVNNTHEKYVVYYPEGHVQNAPVILFFGAWYAMGNYDNNGNKISLRNEGLMKYLASLGCYVIGNKTPTTDWTEGNKWPLYDDALITAKNKGANTKKLGIVGHSAGGMAAYWGMERYKKLGYGKTKSFIIDLQGYYAGSMTKEALRNLKNVDSLIIAYGGLNGDANQTTHADNDFSEDPRVLLTVSHLLPDDVKKGFVVLDTRDHMYSYGEWEEKIMNGDKYDAIKDKKDLLEPIDAMIKYEWLNEGGQYNNAENILFSKYAQTIHDVDIATKAFRDNGGAYKFGCNKVENINYCQDYK